MTIDEFEPGATNSADRAVIRLIGIRVRCPICEKPHEWQVADGSLGTVISTDPRPKGARLAEAQSTLQDLQGSNFQGQSEEIIELREQLTFPDQ